MLKYIELVVRKILLRNITHVLYVKKFLYVICHDVKLRS